MNGENPPKDDDRTAVSDGADSWGGIPKEPIPPRRPLRVGTTVWGLVIAAIGIGLIALACGVDFDVQLAMIVLVASAGTALLVGSMFTMRRSTRR